jgi:hypothetical protein
MSELLSSPNLTLLVVAPLTEALAVLPMIEASTVPWRGDKVSEYDRPSGRMARGAAGSLPPVML